jgi:hypothetical protein
MHTHGVLVLSLLLTIIFGGMNSVDSCIRV